LYNTNYFSFLYGKVTDIRCDIILFLGGTRFKSQPGYRLC